MMSSSSNPTNNSLDQPSSDHLSAIIVQSIHQSTKLNQLKNNVIRDFWSDQIFKLLVDRILTASLRDQDLLRICDSNIKKHRKAHDPGHRHQHLRSRFDLRTIPTPSNLSSNGQQVRSIDFEPGSFFDPSTIKTNQSIVTLFSDDQGSIQRTADWPEESDYDDEDNDDDKSESVRVSENRLVGGTVTIRGPIREIKRLRSTIEVGIYSVCHLRLESFLISELRDLKGQTRPSTPPSTPSIAFAQDTPPHSKRQPTNLTPKNVTPTQQNSGSSGNNTKSQNNHHWITPGSFLYRTYYNQPYRILWKNFETEDSSRKEEAEQEERLDGWELILGSKDEPQLGIDTDEDNEREEEGEDEGDDEEEGDLDEEETVNIRGRGHSNREFVQNLTMSSGSRTFGKNLFQKISKKMNSLSQRHHNRSFSAPQKNHRRLGLESIFHQKPSSSSSPSPSSEQFNEVNDQPGDKQITQNQETHNNQSLTINLPISPTLSDQAVISKPLNKFETVANILNLSILSVSPGVKFPLPYSLEQLLQIQCPEMKQGLQDDPKSIVERSRIGLSLMMKNNVSIEGFLRHQSIQFLLQRVVIDSYNQSIKRVENLDWNCWKYYDRHCSNLRNKTLKGILSGTLQEVILKLFKTLDLSDDLNTSENENEILVLTHNNSRISISLQEDKDCILLSAADELNSHSKQLDHPSIHVSSFCKFCHQDVKPKICSLGSLMIWFMKVLEMMIYDVRLICQNPSCISHADDSSGFKTQRPKKMIRFYHLVSDDQTSQQKIVQKKLRIEVETIELYEVKFPKSIDFNLLELIKEDDCEEENNGEDVAQLRNEIEEFFDSLFDRVLMIDDLLGKYEERFEKTSTNSLDDSLERSLTKGDGTIESCEHLVNPQKLKTGPLNVSKSIINPTEVITVQEKRSLLNNFKQSLKNQKSQLLSQFEFIRSHNLNNLRKPFVDLIVRNRARLKSWESKHLSFLKKSQQYKVQDSDRISLDLPEPRVLIPFYAQEGHHALPADNSVIVRERELASVVAFTLSSGDYKRQFQSYQEPSRRPIYGAASKAHSYHLPTLNAPIDRPNTQTKRDFSLPILSSQAMLDATSPTFLQAQVNLLADKLFSDPDDELGKFGKNCDYSSQIGYRKPPRAGRSILSLKGLSNQRSFDMGSLRSLVSSRVTSPNPNYEVDPLAQAGQSVDIQDGEDRVLNELIKSSEPSSTALSSTLQQSSVPPAPVAALLSRTGRSDPSTVSISHMQTLGVVESSSKGKSQRIKLKSRSSHQSPNTILLSDRETSGTEEEGVGLGERWKLKKDELEESSIETLSDENENFLTEAEKTPPTNKLLNQANNGNSSHQGNLTTPNSTTSTPSSRLISPFQGFWKTSKGSERHRIGSGTEGEEGDDEEELVVTEEEDQEDFVRKMKKTKTKADQEGETPHIKYKLDHGSKEISCTVWYADEFERLRRGLGLNEEELIKSLSRSKDYEPVGGKSRSKFIISKDSKFILKGLINDNYWNESERESLLELLPNYFNYLFKGQDDDEKDDEEKHENGHHPSYGCSGGMMVKILGYYSIKVKTKKNYEKEDLKEKQEEAEVSYNSDVDRSTVDHNLDKDKLNKTLDGEEEDYILMENIFFGKNIERKFDLKGISNRFCKENKKYDSDQEKLKFHTRKDGEGTKDAVDKGEKSIFEIHFGREIFEKNFTGWDGNWIAGNLGNLILIRKESKMMMLKKLKRDLRFLKLNKKVDYSILVGIDSCNKEIVVGLIDVISSFNLAKMIESKSKRVFKSYYYSNTNENNSMKNPKVSLATSSMATVKGRLYNNNNKSEDLVTILPPDLYENRLKKFVEKNFVSAPEKWSRMNKLKSEVVIKEDKNQPKTKNNNSKLESQKSFDDLSKSMINIKSGFKRDEKKDFDNHEELGSKNYFHEENDENYYSRLSPVF